MRPIFGSKWDNLIYLLFPSPPPRTWLSVKEVQEESLPPEMARDFIFEPRFLGILQSPLKRPQIFFICVFLSKACFHCLSEIENVDVQNFWYGAIGFLPCNTAYMSTVEIKLGMNLGLQILNIYSTSPEVYKKILRMHWGHWGILCASLSIFLWLLLSPPLTGTVPQVPPQPSTHTALPGKYLSTMQNVFVTIAKCISSNYNMYLSNLKYTFPLNGTVP